MMSALQADTDRDEKTKKVQTRADSFVQSMDSKKLRDWYRSQLALLPRHLRSAKARVLCELADVLDGAALESLRNFLSRCMEHQQRQKRPHRRRGHRPQDEHMKQDSGALRVALLSGGSPLLCLLVAPPSLDGDNLEELQELAGLLRQPTPRMAPGGGTRY